jgi:hypothetical protein
MVAPQVIALRAARMLAAGASPNARDRREMARMGNEKVEACWESMNAMAGQAMRQWLSAWLNPWAAFSMKASHRSAAKILEKGLIPVHRRAKANARRLSRRPRSR